LNQDSVSCQTRHAVYDSFNSDKTNVKNAAEFLACFNFGDIEYIIISQLTRAEIIVLFLQKKMKENIRQSVRSL